MYHPVGTCKMGSETDSRAVVDPSLNVRGVQGLSVADASIIPSIVGANTNAAAAMCAPKPLSGAAPCLIGMVRRIGLGRRPPTCCSQTREPAVQCNKTVAVH